jgi:PadR family transcriptional regulator, regulatory protein PadR
MIYAIECLRMPRDPFSGHLDMLLLAALRSQPMHGYAIIEYVRQASCGQFDYAEGTIYPALRRLEDDGLVGSRWSKADGRRRRIYDISPQGSKVLMGHRRDWDRFRNGVEAVLDHG